MLNTMQYQITYSRPTDHAHVLAAAFQSLLPPDTLCRSLDEHPTAEADVHLVGFDFRDASLKSIPENVRAFLAQLDGKTIFLFATVPMQPNDIIEKSVSDLAIAALPRECDYLGLYVCPAQPSAALLEELETKTKHHDDNWRAKFWHEQCTRAMGHPNDTDIQNGCRFAAHVLHLTGK